MRLLVFGRFKSKNSYNINNKEEIIAVTSDQNILYYSLPNLERTHQIAGYNEEILDLTLLSPTQLAVVSNSEQIRIYDTKTLNVQILYGHTETVLSIATNPSKSMFVTGSKDSTARVYSISAQFDIKHEYTLLGHTAPVSAVVMGEGTLLTASHDRTIKSWNGEKSKYTFQAHEKDITAIAIAPNNSMFASCALDKTAKVLSN